MLFPRAIKNISGNRDSWNETRMTTRSLGQCASTLPFKNERNFARFNKDLPGFRSREIFFASMYFLFPLVFYILDEPRRERRSPIPPLLFSSSKFTIRATIVRAKFRSVDVTNKIA